MTTSGFFVRRTAHANGARDLIVAPRIERGFDVRERRDVVDPQRDRETVFRDQLPCQAPADAAVAVVVDDAAKDVPAQ